MTCPQCGRPGKKAFSGYCTKVHRRLHRRKPPKLKIPCKSCGQIVVRNPSAVAPSGNVFCKNCGKNRGEYHPKWKEGQRINADGYRVVLIDGSYYREHRVVWEEANLACLLPQGTIHHIDYEKLNNTPENLLLLSNEEHGRFHRFVDANRRAEAAGILRMAAHRQYHYPVGVDAFIAENLRLS